MQLPKTVRHKANDLILTIKAITLKLLVDLIDISATAHPETLTNI